MTRLPSRPSLSHPWQSAVARKRKPPTENARRMQRVQIMLAQIARDQDWLPILSPKRIAHFQSRFDARLELGMSWRAQDDQIDPGACLAPHRMAALSINGDLGDVLIGRVTPLHGSPIDDEVKLEKREQAQRRRAQKFAEREAQERAAEQEKIRLLQERQARRDAEDRAEAEAKAQAAEAKAERERQREREYQEQNRRIEAGFFPRRKSRVRSIYPRD